MNRDSISKLKTVPAKVKADKRIIKLKLII